MGRIEKTVFISYRRTNFWTALAVFQSLHANGYDVFFDYKSIPSGDFEQAITENVKSRAHFIVILSPSALERCNEPGDWLRQEIETAIDYKRNIIPLMMDGFDFGSTATVNALTGKLAELKKFNAMGIPVEYFEDAMIKLRSERFLNRPLESIFYPVSDITKQITEEQKFTASEAAPVEKEQLTAQEWFERGFVFQEAKNLDEAIRCYNETIRLDPRFTFAYLTRGFMSQNKGDFDKAVSDFDKAIELESELSLIAMYHSFKGMAHWDKGEIDIAIVNYSKTIQFDPNYPSIYHYRGEAYAKNGDLDAAIADYDKAIQRDPDNVDIFYSRGEAYIEKGNIDAAVLDFQKYLELGVGKQDGNQKEVEELIKTLKKILKKKKLVKKKKTK